MGSVFFYLFKYPPLTRYHTPTIYCTEFQVQLSAGPTTMTLTQHWAAPRQSLRISDDELFISAAIFTDTSGHGDGAGTEQMCGCLL